MATKEELFISITPQVYLENKVIALKSQSDLLKTLKHFQNLKVLARQKNDLKTQLHKLMSSVIIQIKSLQTKMPTSKVPKTISHHEESKFKSKTTFSKRDEIEEELQLIQSKLKELNS